MEGLWKKQEVKCSSCSGFQTEKKENLSLKTWKEYNQEHKEGEMSFFQWFLALGDVTIGTRLLQCVSCHENRLSINIHENLKWKS